MPPKDSTKMPALKGNAAEETVLEYMRLQNRPYNATDVSANLKNTVTKPMAAKMLAALAEKGELTAKTYGKATIYCITQREGDTTDEASISQMKKERAQLDEQASALASEVKRLGAELKEVTVQPLNEEARERIDALSLSTPELLSEVQKLREANAGEQLVNAAEFESRATDFTKLMTLFRARSMSATEVGASFRDGWQQGADDGSIWEALGGEEPDAVKERECSQRAQTAMLALSETRKAKPAAATAASCTTLGVRSASPSTSKPSKKLKK